MYKRPGDDSLPTSNTTPRRRMTVYQSREGRPRWVLHMQAVFWRVLMRLGMFFHKMALPRPPKPDFYREIPATISGRPGKILLYFYVPKDYSTQRRLWTDRPYQDDEMDAEIPNGPDDQLESEESRDSSPESLGKSQTQQSKQSRRVAFAANVGNGVRRFSTSARQWGGYPVVLNFHGGGFTLGSADDDARWCGTVVDECHAVVVSVEYRLAPEHPFPTAVEDGVDAVMWIHEHADELGIDRGKIALSGFSSGGNMAFTVPLRLYDETMGFPRDDAPPSHPTARHALERAYHGVASRETIDQVDEASPSSSSTQPDPPATRHKSVHLQPDDPTLESQRTSGKGATEAITAQPNPSNVQIRMIVPWYPPVDYTRTREQRRATCGRPDQELPALFTDLFDDSYLHPPHTISLDSPYLSPGVAPTALLHNALPNEIIMHTCEWDMLLDEGRVFKDRLESSEVGKNVWYKMIPEVPHGWDKAPNPWKPTPGVREHYLRACKEMRRVFAQVDKEVGDGLAAKVSSTRPLVERMQTGTGFPTAAVRGSVSVTR